MPKFALQHFMTLLYDNWTTIKKRKRIFFMALIFTSHFWGVVSVCVCVCLRTLYLKNRASWEKTE
jgi:hypothetical protein